MRPSVIIKRVKRPEKANHSAASRTTSGHIQGLCDYVDDADHDGEKLQAREGAEDEGPISFGLNFVAEDSNRDGQIAELKANATANTNEKAHKIEHVTISLETGKTLDADGWRQAVQTTLENLGMADHLCRVSVHRNTENEHAHLVLCKVRPEPDASDKYRVAIDGGSVTSHDDRGRERNNIALCLQRAASLVASSHGWEIGKHARFDGEGKLLSPAERTDRAKGYDAQAFVKWLSAYESKSSSGSATHARPDRSRAVRVIGGSATNYDALQAAIERGDYAAAARFWEAFAAKNAAFWEQWQAEFQRQQAEDKAREQAEIRAIQREAAREQRKERFVEQVQDKFINRQYEAEKFQNPDGIIEATDRKTYVREDLQKRMALLMPVAKSWADVKTLLPAQVILTKKGQGAVLAFYGQDGKKEELKLSDIAREHSFGNLTKRFQDTAFPVTAKEPASTVTPTPLPAPPPMPKGNASNGGGAGAGTPAPVPVTASTPEERPAERRERREDHGDIAALAARFRAIGRQRRIDALALDAAIESQRQRAILEREWVERERIERLERERKENQSMRM